MPPATPHPPPTAPGRIRPDPKNHPDGGLRACERGTPPAVGVRSWSIGGASGPLLLSNLYDANHKSYGTPLTIIGLVAAVSVVLPLVTRPPRAVSSG